MNSFSQQMDTWMNQKNGWMYENEIKGRGFDIKYITYQMFTPMFTKLEHSQEYLDQMKEFIQKNSRFISREEAESYLPSLMDRVCCIDPKHAVLKKIQEIKENLLFSDIKLDNLPPEILCFIVRREVFYTWEKLASINRFFADFMKHPSILKGICERDIYSISVRQRINFAFLTRNIMFSLDVSHPHIVRLYQPSYDKKIGLADETLEKLSHLTHLKLGNCHPITTRHLTRLQSLDAMQYEGSIVSLLKPLTQLQFLSINNLFCSSLDELKQFDEISKSLTNLKSLWIHSCHINGEFLKPLSCLTSLSIEKINRLRDSDSKSLSNVQVLHLGWANDLTDNFFKRLTQLTSLSINWNNKITNEVFKYLTNLQALQFGDCCYLTDECLKPLTRLQSLDVTNHPGFPTDQSSKYLTHIQSLVVRIDYLTDEFFKPLSCLKSLTLKSQSFLSPNKITNEAFKFLTNLQFLNIEKCESRLLTDEFLEPLIHLQSLHVPDHMLPCKFKWMKGLRQSSLVT